VSQQNTNTGKLTPKMIDAVLAQAKELIARPSLSAGEHRVSTRPLARPALRS
jgi:hypothetical protein